MIPEKVTIGEKYGAAMMVQTAEEAAAYFEECVEHMMRLNPWLSRTMAEAYERDSIGLYSGYYGREMMARIRRLYGFGHPVFHENDTPEAIREKLRQIEERMRDQGKSSPPGRRN